MKANGTRIGLMLLLIALGGPVLSGGQLTFDVASIRQNTSLTTGGGGGPRPGGSYVMRNMTVRGLIGIAYGGLPASRVLGGPEWLNVDRYDINARSKPDPTPDEAGQMLQALLRDRFSLAVQLQKRELPVYELTFLRSDRQLGPNLCVAKVDCKDPQAAKAANTADAATGSMACGISFDNGRFTGGGVEMATLERTLIAPAGRPVIDRTGLTGGYDVDLRWTPTVGTEPASGDAISIFTAVQEQLGLKLESSTAPLDVVVITRVERPTTD
jgi:uncharacterized protein (TIGR03435 family)